MLQIYAVPVSLYCAKLRILLRHKGLEWEEIPPPGGYGSQAYKKVMPSGNLPALTDGNLSIGDSEAIAEYLEEKHPSPEMLPDNPVDRAKVRERSRFHDTRLEPEVRKLFPHVLPGDRNDDLVRQQADAIQVRLDQLEKLTSNISREISAQLTLGDCGYPITFAWLDMLNVPLGLNLTYPYGVLEYRERLEAVSAVSQELSDYRPKLKSWFSERIGA